MTDVSADTSALPRSGPIRIGLLGMYASRNLGDVAIQLAVMSALHARHDNIEFVGLCQDPEDTVRTFNIAAIASSGKGELLTPATLAETLRKEPRAHETRWSRLTGKFYSLRQIQRQMSSLDMLLISGSGQIDDFWGGPWAQPFRLMAWSFAARSQGKRVVVFGVGVDELRTSLGEWFCIRALNCAAICVVRDSGSREALRRLGYRRTIDVCADPAFHLDVKEGARATGEAERFAVISPISRRAWPGPEDDSYDTYLSTLASVAEYLQERSLNVRFVCSQIRMDPPIVDRILDRMKPGTIRPAFVDVKTVDEYLAAVKGAQLIVGSRLHALILALITGVPAVAISAVRKVHQQFADIGLADHAFAMQSLQLPELLARIDAIIAYPDQVREKVVKTTREFRSQNATQFDRIAKLIPAKRAAD